MVKGGVMSEQNTLTFTGVHLTMHLVHPNLGLATITCMIVYTQTVVIVKALFSYICCIKTDIQSNRITGLVIEV